MKAKFAQLLVSAAAIALTAASPPTARGADESVAPAPDKNDSDGEKAVQLFIAGSIPDASFLDASSRLAIALSNNADIRAYAERVANAQAKAANSLVGWVNAIGPVVTDRSIYPGRKEEAPVGRVSAPQMLQSQTAVLQRLSTLRGRDFDALYISAQKEALQHLTGVYQTYIDANQDGGLRAIAVRELAGAKDSLSTLNALPPNEAGTPRRAP